MWRGTLQWSWVERVPLVLSGSLMEAMGMEKKEGEMGRGRLEALSTTQNRNPPAEWEARPPSRA